MLLALTQTGFCLTILLLAGQTHKLIGKSFAALAHPANLPGRDPHHKCMIRNVSGDNSACSDKGILADGVSADDGAVGAQGCAAFDQGSAIFMLARNVAARVIDVGEHHAGAAKHVIFQRYRVVNTDIVLHFDVAADDDIAADKDVLSEGTALANVGSSTDVYPVPDAGVVANNSAFINDGGFVFEVTQRKPPIGFSLSYKVELQVFDKKGWQSVLIIGLAVRICATVSTAKRFSSKPKPLPARIS